MIATHFIQRAQKRLRDVESFQQEADFAVGKIEAEPSILFHRRRSLQVAAGSMPDTADCFRQTGMRY